MAKLVVGGDSLIGSAIADWLLASGEDVIVTTRRRTSATDGNAGAKRLKKAPLDLGAAPLEWSPPSPVEVAYLCAGVTKLDVCRSDPVRSRLVNVTGLANLAKSLIRQGIFVVYLSSGQVFDGSKPVMNPDHPGCPMTEYGRQKAAAEDILLRHANKTAVVRLTKVVGPGMIFSKWARSLLAGETVRPFTDMVMSPIPLAFVVSALRLIGDSRRGGIWQLSGDRDVSYAQAAQWGAGVLGVDQSLIEATTSGEANVFLEANPVNTTLDTNRLQSELGIIPPPVKRVIERAFEEVSQSDEK